jgi:hypothetical protein
VPPAGVPADYTREGHRANLDTHGFRTLADYSRATGQDRHSVLVGYDVFMHVPMLDAQNCDVQTVYRAEDLDFRLNPGSAGLDKGVSLPNVNDGFTGAPPDLGALEIGRETPHDGRRP